MPILIDEKDCLFFIFIKKGLYIFFMYKILLELYACIYVYMYVLYSKIADEFMNDEKNE